MVCATPAITKELNAKQEQIVALGYDIALVIKSSLVPILEQ